MIKVFESFAGIGTQRMALENQGIKHEVTAISEIDEYAILSYHAIHTADIEVKEVSEEEMQRYMEEKNIPLDPKGKRKILKKKRLKDLYVASVASNNLGDISKITDDEIPKVDLFTYSFPCQDISLAGKQEGLDKNSGTRSSLLWECEKIIEAVKPKYLLMENVKALVNKKNKPQFDIWLEYLEELGYKNFWQVLNAKDYGIPQNRERVFVVSILDENADYKFPTKIPLTLRLKDILEDNVDDSYYLSQEQVDRITFSTYDTNRRRIQEKEYSDTLCARDFKDPKCVVVGGVGEKNFGKQYRQGNRIYDGGIAACLHSSPVGGAGGQSNLYIIPNTTTDPKCVKVRQIGHYSTPTRQNSSRYRVYDKEAISPTLTSARGGNIDPHILDDELKTPVRIGGIFDKEGKKHQAGAIWDKEGLAPTLDTMQGGWRQPSVMIKNATKKGYVEANNGDGIDLAYPTSKTRCGRVQKNMSQTLTADDSKGVIEQYRIRKLTPNECWRLMGVPDENFEKANKVVSNSQLYKQAGNAIVVDVLEGIFKQLFNPDEN